jgi:hypothetical protein
MRLKGRHLDTTEMTESESQALLNTSSRMHLKWQKRLEWCIGEEGDYEGDGMQ